MNSVTMCDGCVAVLGGGKITVTIDADRHSESFARCRWLFSKSRTVSPAGLVSASAAHSRQRSPLATRTLSESTKPACRLHFDGLACQKCFCVTLDKSNRTEDEQVYEIGGITYAKNDKRNGG